MPSSPGLVQEKLENKEKFKNVIFINRLVDAGIVRKLVAEQFWLMERREREHYRKNNSEKNKPIKVGQLIGTCFILALGLVLSIAAMLIEKSFVRTTVI